MGPLKSLRDDEVLIIMPHLWMKSIAVPIFGRAQVKKVG
jgi:hypothetical protein